MSGKNPLSKWYEGKISYLDANYEKHKTSFEIIFAISLGIVLMVLPILPRGVDLSMTWQYWVLVLFIWVSVFCASYLIRNSHKKASNTEKKLDELTKAINELIKRIDERWSK